MDGLAAQIEKEHLLDRHHSGYANSCWDLVHRFAIASELPGATFKQFMVDIGSSYRGPLCGAVWLGLLEFMPWDLIVTDPRHRFVFSVELHNLFNLELNYQALTVEEAVAIHGASREVDLARTWDTDASSIQQMLTAMVDGVRRHGAAQEKSKWLLHGFHSGAPAESEAAKLEAETAAPLFQGTVPLENVSHV